METSGLQRHELLTSKTFVLTVARSNTLDVVATLLAALLLVSTKPSPHACQALTVNLLESSKKLPTASSFQRNPRAYKLSLAVCIQLLTSLNALKSKPNWSDKQ